MAETVDDLLARQDALQDDKNVLQAQIDAVRAEQAGLLDLIAVAEQRAGDDAALAALAERVDSDNSLDAAVAARTIAATMPDADRAARFTAFANDLAG